MVKFSPKPCLLQSKKAVTHRVHMLILHMVWTCYLIAQYLKMGKNKQNKQIKPNQTKQNQKPKNPRIIFWSSLLQLEIK